MIADPGAAAPAMRDASIPAAPVPGDASIPAAPVPGIGLDLPVDHDPNSDAGKRPKVVAKRSKLTR